MSVKFNIVERGNPSNREAPKKFYPSIQSSGRVSTREMAEMAAQRSTLSTMDMMAAIESFMAIIPEQLTKGNIVELGEFGSFWLRTTADGAETVEEVRANQVTSILPRFIPGKQFKRTLDGIEFSKGVVTTTVPED